MRAVAVFLALAAAPLGAFSASSRATTLKESVHVPRGWTRRARAPAAHNIDLRIGLPQGDFAELERHLYEVSDRES
jgi:tripeptidyl-peptidase-1